MNRRARTSLMAGLILGPLLAVLSAGVATAQGNSGAAHLSNIQKRLLSGFASFALNENLAPGQVSGLGQGFGGLGPTATPNYFPAPNGNCEPQTASNAKVNQNCLNLSDPDLQGRGQAQNETSIAQDPNAPNHLIAAFNDYRRGDGNCGIAWSVNGGTTWQDSTVPSGFVRGGAFGGVARECSQAAGDPSDEPARPVSTCLSREP